MMDSVRIDKYLWAIRVFKTRSEATDACNGNRVQVNGVNAKPSKAIKAGDSISVRKNNILYQYRVISPAQNRMGASLVPDFADNLTPESELAKLHAPVEIFFVRREHGAGRPTKKERRSIDALWESMEEE